MIELESANLNKLSSEDLSTAYEILRHAYAVTEVEIWGENYSRVSLDEFRELLDKNEFIIARIDDKVVGSIHTFKISDDAFSFGLLSADFSKKGMGIGRALVCAAEERAIQQGASIMELELLKPRDLEVPVKKVLHDWYQRLGYVYTATFSFIERKPDKVEKAKTLMVPSVFDCYKKLLK